MHKLPPLIHPLPGTIVKPRRRIIMPLHPTYQAWAEALRIVAAAADLGEPCPLLIAPQGDDPPHHHR